MNEPRNASSQSSGLPDRNCAAAVGGTHHEADHSHRPHPARAQIVAWKGTGSVDETLEWLKTAQPVPRMGEPAEAAQAVLATLTNGFMAGALVAVDGGYTCV